MQNRMKWGFWGLVFLLGVSAFNSELFAQRKKHVPANPMAEKLTGKSCRFWKDESSIEHVKSEDPMVAISCLGYLHARDRLWEMDYFRKVAHGKKAEYFGVSGIRTDLFMRLLNLKGQSERIFGEMQGNFKSMLWAYSYGVNQAIGSVKQDSQEFKHFGYEVKEMWRPEDTIAIALLQSFDQTRRDFELQFKEQKRINHFGSLAAKLFDYSSVPWATTILKDGEFAEQKAFAQSSSHLEPNEGRSSSGYFEVSPGLVSEVQSFFPSSAHGVGSNSWVVGPSRSQSGHAWMANDPHLELTHPSFWYWVHLDTLPFNVIGATVPGVPVVVSGTNSKVSWGVTDAFLPTARIARVLDQEIKGRQKIRPIIWVKFWKFKLPYFFTQLQRTPQGHPILPISTEIKDEAENVSLVLRWTGLNLTGEDFEALYDVMASQSARQVDRAFARSGVPTFNFVYADVEGNIGYRAVGRVARFQERPSYGIPRMSLGEVERSPYFDQPLEALDMPNQFNPRRAYLATANNRQWLEGSKWSAGQSQAQEFRAYRIEELLAKKEKHDLESLHGIQMDVQSVDAPFFLEKLLSRLPDSSDYEVQKKILADWDYESDRNSRAVALYRRWMDHLEDEELWDPVGLYRVISDANTGDVVFGTKEKLDEKILQAFQKAVEDIESLNQGVTPKWGSVHGAPFFHLSGDKFAWENHWLATPGDEHSVNPGTATWMGDYFKHTAGASHRLIVEMTDPPQAHFALASSNDASIDPHMEGENSPWASWRDGKLKRLAFPLDWTQVAAQEFYLE